METERLQAACQMIREARHITLVGHVSPDGDVLGSMLGFHSALSKLGKECVAVLPDSIPAALRFLPDVDRIVERPESIAKTDLIVVLDVSDTERLGTIYSNNVDLFSSTPILNVDHHATNSLAATVAILDTSAAATAELVVDLVKSLAIPLDMPTAICLLAALVSDTQSFRTPNTTTRSLQLAVELIERGASLPWVVDCLFKTHSLSKLTLWGNALSTIELVGSVVWAQVSQDTFARCGAAQDETDGLIDMLAGVHEAKVAAFFRETPQGAIKVSLRSSGQANVAEMAAYFGGGGHPGAAGLTVDGPMELALETVLGHINRQLWREE